MHQVKQAREREERGRAAKRITVGAKVHEQLGLMKPGDDIRSKDRKDRVQVIRGVGFERPATDGGIEKSEP